MGALPFEMHFHPSTPLSKSSGLPAPRFPEKGAGWPRGFLRHASFDLSAVPARRAVLRTILLWLPRGE